MKGEVDVKRELISLSQPGPSGRGGRSGLMGCEISTEGELRQLTAHKRPQDLEGKTKEFT